MTALEAAAKAADGFITTDVVVQPGYAGNSNQQNPFYNRYGFPVGSTRATSEYSFIVPTNYILNQYQNNKDPRIEQIYRKGQKNVPGTMTATPAYVGTDLGEQQPPQFNPADGATVGSRFLQGGTFLRGANAPVVLMLLAEHLFSKSEAETRNLFSGSDAAAEVDFNNGIKASFLFTYRPASNLTPTTLAAGTAGVAEYEKYLKDNVANSLVNYKLATTSGDLGKQSVILYQKYLAENTVASTEAWDDYRRAAQPKFTISKRAGVTKLPTRLFYPQSEVETNAANVPKGVDQFTKIFWDVVD